MVKMSRYLHRYLFSFGLMIYDFVLQGKFHNKELHSQLYSSAGTASAVLRKQSGLASNGNV